MRIYQHLCQAQIIFFPLSLRISQLVHHFLPFSFLILFILGGLPRKCSVTSLLKSDHRWLSKDHKWYWNRTRINHVQTLVETFKSLSIFLIYTFIQNHILYSAMVLLVDKKRLLQRCILIGQSSHPDPFLLYLQFMCLQPRGT